MDAASTNTVASAAVASPLWLPTIQDVSSTASSLLPILGGLWLLTQLYQAWMKYFREK